MHTFTTDNPPNKRGDVAHRYRVAGEVGDLHGIAIRLVGHAYVYICAIVTGRGGPKLVDLQIRSDDNTPITPDALRAIPSRRLAYAAAQYASEADGQIYSGPFLGQEVEDMTPEETDVAAQALQAERAADDARPEAATSRGRRGPEHYQRVADLVREATRSGQSARRVVAEEFHVTLPAVDKWIRRCKDDGLIAEDELR